MRTIHGFVTLRAESRENQHFLTYKILMRTRFPFCKTPGRTAGIGLQYTGMNACICMSDLTVCMAKPASLFVVCVDIPPPSARSR